ncbi:MAG: hypothetical protein QNJ46_10725 [Leptolyngbyaceae cyanobacterium MO_188.B28]|nr:hypothetical protein [Leptolyngbyaceae cyanobacterium MO_188.B28]
MSQRKHDIFTGGLILIGGLVLFVGFSRGLDTVSKQVNLSKPAQPQQPEPVDFYQQALNYGMQAAIAAQTAETRQEWEAVAALWSHALEKLQNIPQHNPDYDAVRQKILEYQTNREYAQKLQEIRSR